ncbi:hypothetical protein CRG98_023432, partial [Punica granatum]
MGDLYAWLVSFFFIVALLVIIVWQVKPPRTLAFSYCLLVRRERRGTLFYIVCDVEAQSSVMEAESLVLSPLMKFSGGGQDKDGTLDLLLLH